MGIFEREPSVLSTLTTCTVEGCKKYAHAKGLCQAHYDAERRFQAAEAEAASGEAKPPQARGGRRRKRPIDAAPNPAYPPSRTRGLRAPWRKGESGNPAGMAKSIVEIHRLAREMTPAALEKLNEIVHDPKAANRDKIMAAAQILDRGLGRAAMAVFHGGPNQIGNTELLVDDTPLTRLARQGSNYEADLRAELRRIDAEREKERVAKEDELAAARADKARGKEIHPALAALLAVKDDDTCG